MGPDLCCLRPLTLGVCGLLAPVRVEDTSLPSAPLLSDSLKPLLFFFFFLEVKEKEKRGNYLQHPLQVRGVLEAAGTAGREGLGSRCDWSLC